MDLNVVDEEGWH